MMRKSLLVLSVALLTGTVLSPMSTWAMNDGPGEERLAPAKAKTAERVAIHESQDKEHAMATRIDTLKTNIIQTGDEIATFQEKLNVLRVQKDAVEANPVFQRLQRLASALNATTDEKTEFDHAKAEHGFDQILTGIADLEVEIDKKQGEFYAVLTDLLQNLDASKLQASTSTPSAFTATSAAMLSSSNHPITELIPTMTPALLGGPSASVIESDNLRRVYKLPSNTDADEGYFGRLPAEVTSLIFEKLNSPQDVLALLQVSQRMHESVKNASLSLSITLRSPTQLRGMWDSKSFNSNHITSIKLSDFTPTLDDLARLGSLPRLQHIDLSFTEVTDISALANAPQLHTLCLTRCTGVTDVSALANAPQLHTLYLTRCTGVTDVSTLANALQLHTLYLMGCTGVTDVSALANALQLHTLILGRTGVTDVSALANALQLHTLFLSRTGVTDASILALANAPHLHLHTLNLEGCTHVTEAAITELQRLQPDLKIIR